MADLFAEWDEKRERATRPTQPAAGPVDPGRATAYALAALQGEVDNLLGVPIGEGRNDQLNRSALKMYGLAEAGAISHDVVTATLGAADGGLDYPATRKTLDSARQAAARLGPRAIPDPTTTTREVAPWETSDDPLNEHYAPPPNGSPGVSTSGPPATATATGTTSTPTSTSTAGPGAAPAAAETSDPDAALVQFELRKQRISRTARRLLAQEEAAHEFRPPPYLPTLTDELDLPDEPITYAVADVMPTGANVLLTAQFKTGKTTLVNNLTRARVDGVPFLGRYEVTDLDGRVAIFNYEVDGRQYRRWLRDAGIVNTDRVALLNLRGYRLPLMSPHVEDWVVEWLKRAEVSVWIVDPFARAAVGSVTSENDNTEVGALLDTLDVIKGKAGVSELILPTHTGRAVQDEGDERARGATRLDDWADVRWLLTKDKDGVRYFRASGRDVETDSRALDYDEATRALTLTDMSPSNIEQDRVRNAVMAVVHDFPGIGARDLRDRVKLVAAGAAVARIDKAVMDLMAAGKVHRTTDSGSGAGRPRVGHHLGRDPDSIFPDGPKIVPDPLE